MSPLDPSPSTLAADPQVVLNGANCSLIAVDLDGIVRTFNPAAERCLGYTAAEVIGRCTPTLFHDPDELRRRADELSQEFGEPVADNFEVFTARVRRGLSDEREWTYVRKDGRRFPVLLSLTGLRDAQGQLVGCLLTGIDLTVHKRAERRVSVQHAAARVLAEAASLTEAVPVLLRTLCHDLQWDFGAYWLVYDGLDLIAGTAVWHEADRFREFSGVTRQLAFPPGIDLPGRVWQSGKAVWTPDVTREGFFLRADLAEREGLHAGFAFPIRFRGRTLGVLEFFSRDVLPPDPDLLKVFDTVGTQIGQFLDRQQAVEKLAQSEERFRALVENSSDAFALLDGDGGFLYASSANARVVGLAPSELHGRSLFDLIHPDDRVAMRRQFDDCLGRTGVRIEFECRITPPEGSWRHIEGVFTNRADVPTVEAVVANYRDVTERKRAEEALRDSEARYRDLFENATDLILNVDANGAIRYVNPAWHEALGYLPEELTRLRLKDVLHPSGRDATLELFARVQSEGIAARAEVEFLTRDGRTLSAEGSLNGRPTDGPTPSGVRGIFRDVTQRRAVERMKAEFISTVSHELRTPLTSIRGSLGLIAGGAAGVLPAQAARLVDIAHNSSERLVRLINDILDIEKIESGHLQFQLRPLELVPLVEQALEANRAYGEQFRVLFSLCSESPVQLRVLADPDRLMQVLNNLLSNAAKFSPTDGEVTVRIEPLADAAAGKRWVRLSVQDHGPGIPESFRPRIFQKFAQADSSDRRQRGGTGLGLSISRAIVERLGGRISFETGSGGTTFHVDLPVYRDPEVETPRLPAHAPRVLVCEDDPDFALLIKLMLGQSGYATDEARTVAEARELLRHHQYVCATLDLRLPDGDGLTFLRELRANPTTRGLPVVIVSALATDRSTATPPEELAVIDWIDKPIDPTRLLHAIGQSLRPAAASAVRILVAEDDPDTRQVIVAVLEPLGQVASASTLAEVRQLLATEPFDLLVLDLEFPEGSGLELLPDLPQRDGAPIPVLVFSARELPAGRPGVTGTLVKSQTSNTELLGAVRALLNRG